MAEPENFQVVQALARFKLGYTVAPLEVGIHVPNAVFTPERPSDCIIWVPHEDGTVIKARVHASGRVLMYAGGAEASKAPLKKAFVVAQHMATHYRDRLGSGSGSGSGLGPEVRLGLGFRANPNPHHNANAQPKPVSEFVLLSVSATARAPSRLRLEEFFQAHPYEVDYDRDRHKAAFYNLDEPQCKVTVFPSGRLFVGRVKGEDEAREALRFVNGLLLPFYKKRSKPDDVA
mmetsp:Transcript_39930/g.124910  ORF Transcript_39930/g.124910 Transcript_39930/m.124910 type:complete len:232 (+) Transcript_39930:93-788(+)